MEILYKREKYFTAEQLEQLFLSVEWESGKHPEKLVIALRNSSRVISAWDNNKLIGLIRGLDDGIWQATIDCLLVHSEYQGRGIASNLVEMLKEDYKDILYLDVMPDEKKNISFYKKHGFSVMREGTAMQLIGRKWD